ncbi:cactin-like [Lytechinus variegatus]|uniref:cactin-like n=1 Tax=Lytechinus variegatus TaxID=7654 RepID=UPI001BB192EA|nr:cactin-like [Lytechinus variegatus]
MGRSKSDKKSRRSRSRERRKDYSRHRKRSVTESSDSEEERRRHKKQKSYRSQSRSTPDSSNSEDESRRRHKKQKEYKSRSRSTPESNDSEEDRRRHKKQKKHRSRSRSRSESRSRSKYEERDRHHSHKHKKRRSRSRTRSRSPIKQPDVRPKTVVDEKMKKSVMKATETMEEKRLRRMAKKQLKDRKRKEQMGWDEEMMGYTNEDNPFGDPNLLDTFVWVKKNEKLGITDVEPDQMKRLVKKKQIENRLELQKVKQRRIEREKEREQRDKELEELQRAREADYYKEWERQEDHFHLNQAKLRSKVRIKDGRGKPIDLLGQYISAEDDEDISVEMQEPYNVLKGLTIPDLEDLMEDIKVYVELEQGKNVEFWKDITVIAEDELNKLKKITPEGQEVSDRREGINSSVSSDVANVFKNKTHVQLLALKSQIVQRIQSGNAVDIGYWESLQQQLDAHMARARLRELHQEKLRNKLAALRQQQGVEAAPLFPSAESTSAGWDPTEQKEKPSTESAEIDIPSEDDEEEEEKKEDEAKPGSSADVEGAVGGVEEGAVGGAAAEEEPESILTEEDLAEESYVEYIQGNYSPRLLEQKDLSIEIFVQDPDEDKFKLETARKHLISTGSAETDAETEFIKKAKQEMGKDESTFAVEVNLEQKPYMWSDKYRPRKPRFFNRVHTGFEWNKYNQTHYDMDNPPPKIVQGYKFNIFFPDLIDKRKTPEYTLTPIAQTPDFGILTFHAGPPYEDIAFKIVNREWEYSHRHGFRCQFSNSIFQLWFRFKRYRYRR